MEAGPGESRGEARIGAYEQNQRKKGRRISTKPGRNPVAQNSSTERGVENIRVKYKNRTFSE